MTEMPAHSVYCSSCVTGEIIRFMLDEHSGRLERLDAIEIPDARVPTISHPLALSRDRRMLFAAVRLLPYRIATFDVSPADGSLAFRSASPTAGSLAYLTLDSTGKFLLGASLPDSLLVSHRIDPDAGIAEVPVQVIRDVRKAHSIVMRFDVRTGMLRSASQSDVALHSGAGPRHLAFDTRQRFLYCLNETDGTIDVLARDAQTGALRPLQTASMFAPGVERPANVRAADLAVGPDGRFLYASERSSSTVASFRIEADSGKLQRIGWMPTEDTPRAMRMTPSGRLLLVAGELSGCLMVYAIDASTGEPRPVSRQPAGIGVNWIVMMESPAGRLK